MAIIGAGFGGLLTGARLRQLGVESVRLIDRAADVGGTWYWNRYPGIACDVESYVYMPLLEELGYIPTEKYAKGAGDLRPLPAHRRALRPLPQRLPADRGARDPLGRSESRWVIRTDRGDEMRARFVSMANGYQPKPKLPGIPGIDAFRGHTFHTSRWDYAYTGADAGAPGRQARRHHRHRSHRDPVRPAPGRGGAAALRLPAHAVVGRRARQPADRSAVGRHIAAGLAAAADRELPDPHRRRRRPRRIWSPTPGRASPGSFR